MSTLLQPRDVINSHQLVIAMALLVLRFTVAGLGGNLQVVAARTTYYTFWDAAAGLVSEVSAFVDSATDMIGNLGIPKMLTLAIMAIFVGSFAGTTPDTATRTQRCVAGKLGAGLKMNFLADRYVATITAGGSV